MNKEDLRIFGKEKRLGILNRSHKSKLIITQLAKLIKEKGVLSFSIYRSFGTEVETNDIISWGKENNLKVYHPIVLNSEAQLMLMLEEDNNYLKQIKLSNVHCHEQDNLNFKDLEIAQEAIEMHICPLLLFDNNLNRLGYGKGYYDKYFTYYSKSSLKIGLAFCEQKIECLPIEPHDIKLDAIITEEEILYP